MKRFAFFVCAWGVGCSSENKPAPEPPAPAAAPPIPAPAAAAEAQPAATEPAAAAPAAEVKMERAEDIHGLNVAFASDATITLTGKDRFGNAVDTRYESKDFLRNALPSLRLSLSGEQVDGLEKLVGVPTEAEGAAQPAKAKAEPKPKAAAKGKPAKAKAKAKAKAEAKKSY
jgi:hypothetical protein